MFRRGFKNWEYYFVDGEFRNVSLIVVGLLMIICVIGINFVVKINYWKPEWAPYCCVPVELQKCASEPQTNSQSRNYICPGIAVLFGNAFFSVHIWFMCISAVMRVCIVKRFLFFWRKFCEEKLSDIFTPATLKIIIRFKAKWGKKSFVRV